MALTDYLTSVADAIREKTGTTGKIPALEFASMILSIPQQSEGGGDGSRLCIDEGVYYPEKNISLQRTATVYEKQFITIPHNLKRRPFFVCFTYDNTLEGGDPSSPLVPKTSAYQSCMGLILDSNPNYTWRFFQSGTRINGNGSASATTVDSNTNVPIIRADENNIYIHGQSGTTSYLYKGIPYRWFAA
ncbi:hypothetical protein D6855_15915 [Butyrivibrio sp. CB08]|uniref:hypothetical protein n=1 Tax=Butyrivibrio sp. CB08 TaxID=2364879 RepID=UPI000EAA5B62|nr:hypothetical protein [Butyrivibrio sp. CB08]RKM55421.1 hypothetical protein D6855_15915 [Butyrivibrio sp. CB08]